MAFALNNSNTLFNTLMAVSGYPFSLLGWFRVPNVTSLTPLMGLVNFSPAERCDIYFAGDSTKAAVAKSVSATSGTASSTSAMTPGQWHHVAAVFSAADKREIYLDGGSVGVDTTSVSISTLSIFYVGNLVGTDFVDVAETALVGTAVSAEQAAALAQGCPVLASPLAGDLISYQDCIRRKNRPGLGVTLSSSGSMTVIDHPRVLFAANASAALLPARVRGPFQMEQALCHSRLARQGQASIAGVVSNSPILPAKVVS